MAIMTAITRLGLGPRSFTRKANPTGTIAPTARLSMCIFEQMLVSEQAVMVQACRQPQSAGGRGKDSSARSIALSNSCGALAH